jgi:hypothetical protein
MCLSYRQLDPKTSRLMRIANVSLILGILLWTAERWNWVNASSQFEQNWLDAFTGFFFSLYIGIVLFGLRGARRCHASEPENL